MIVSASYKTDIPAFYAEWFRNRLQAGYCKMVNAYNRAQQRTVSLRAEDVDAFVFWTKNIGPFRPALAEVAARGVPFIVHLTLNPYPRQLEPALPAAQRRVEQVRWLARAYGPRVVVWRYDPILFSELTPLGYHLAEFSALADQLAGSVDEVVVKFANLYRKTTRNLHRASRSEGFAWWDPPAEEKCELLSELGAIARARGLRLRLCSQPELLVAEVEPSVCVDPIRLADVAGRPVSAVARGVRPGCRCAAAIDIGEYDTCPHGCVYCYAVEAQERAVTQLRQKHDPTAEYLIMPRQAAPGSAQLALF